MEPGLGKTRKTNDGRVGAGSGLGGRRYRVSQTGHALGSCGAAVLRNVRQDGQLPDRSECSSCGRTRKCTAGWRLYLPESWANDAQRRSKASIPEGIVFRKKWELALEIIDQIREWGLPDRVVLGDAGYGDGTEFREALERRELNYAVGVLPQVGVWLQPPKISPLQTTGRGRPPTAARYGDQRPTTAQEAARQAKGWRTIRWREGSKGWLESRFWATRVQPSHRYQDGRPPGKEVWLLAEWPESEKAPLKFCLCDLPAGYSLRRIVRLVKCRWKIEQDYHQLKEELGLDHYEGRNWQGWHHHVTMVMIAHAFLTLETLRGKKNFWVDPAEDAT